MRMKYMYYLLKESLPALESLGVVREGYTAGGQHSYRGQVTNWIDAKKALTDISKIPYFNDFCMSILENSEMRIGLNSFVISDSLCNDLEPKYKKFLTEVKGIIGFYESAGFNNTEQGFDIKMPPTDDFGEFAKNIDLLNKALSQCPYLNQESERIILKKTDVGSIWFELGIAVTGTSVILFNLSKIVDMCVKIKSHYVTVKQQEEQYRVAQIKDELLETVVKANKQLIETITNNCIEELKKEIPETPLDNDAETRLKYSLEILTSLMDKGMEIYASIDSPQEVKDLFPTSDEMMFMPHPKRMLTSSEDDVE